MIQKHSVYLAAHGGKSLLWHAYDLLFAFLLTQYMGLGPLEMGITAMSLMLFAAVMDVVSGYLIAKGPETPERLATIQLVGALLSGAAFAAVFLVRDVLPPMLHAACFGVAFQLAYKLYDIPQNAMTSVLTRHPDDVLSLSTGRYLLSGIAKIAVAGAAYLLIAHDPQIDAQGPVYAFTIIVCVPALLSSALLWFLPGIAAAPLPADHAARGDEGGERAAGVGLRTDAIDAIAGSHVDASCAIRGGVTARLPDAMPRLLLAAVAYSALAAVMGRAFPYFENGANVLACFAAGSLLSLPMLRAIASRHGEHTAFLGAATMAAGASLLIVAGQVIFPGSDALAYPAALIYGGGVFGGTMLLWGAAANMIHAHFSTSGARSDVFAYGVFTFASKIGIALSLLLLGVTLEIGPLAASGQRTAVIDIEASAWLVCMGAAISVLAVYPAMRSMRVRPD